MFWESQDPPAPALAAGGRKLQHYPPPSPPKVAQKAKTKANNDPPDFVRARDGMPKDHRGEKPAVFSSIFALRLFRACRGKSSLSYIALLRTLNSKQRRSLVSHQTKRSQDM